MAEPYMLRHNGIRVSATERGVPLTLRLSQAALSSTPSQLARDIVLLCRLSAQRAQLEQRNQLTAAGFDPAVIDSLELCTDGQLAHTEAIINGQLVRDRGTSGRLQSK
ncbi:hypothetical protein BH11ACT6_BH11ACT6_35490 [soil metagenome]